MLSRNVIKKAENVTVISCPDKDYIGHYIPESGTSLHNLNGLLEFLERRGLIFRDSLQVINLDGTATNTGPKGGLLSLIEENIKRPIQWAICFLHHLERPWLHLFLHIDGRSLGPEAFSGPIGKELSKGVHNLPVAQYEKIHVDMVSRKCNLSTII